MPNRREDEMVRLLLVRVPSLTRSGTSPYEIEQAGPHLICSCPAFTFGKREGKSCKHLRIYRAAARALVRCREQHGGDGARICRQCLVTLLAAIAAKVAHTPHTRRPGPVAARGRP